MLEQKGVMKSEKVLSKLLEGKNLSTVTTGSNFMQFGEWPLPHQPPKTHLTLHLRRPWQAVVSGKILCCPGNQAHDGVHAITLRHSVHALEARAQMEGTSRHVGHECIYHCQEEAGNCEGVIDGGCGFGDCQMTGIELPIGDGQRQLLVAWKPNVWRGNLVH